MQFIGWFDCGASIWEAIFILGSTISSNYVEARTNKFWGIHHSTSTRLLLLDIQLLHLLDWPSFCSVKVATGWGDSFRPLQGQSAEMTSLTCLVVLHSALGSGLLSGGKCVLITARRWEPSDLCSCGERWATQLSAFAGSICFPSFALLRNARSPLYASLYRWHLSLVKCQYAPIISKEELALSLSVSIW